MDENPLLSLPKALLLPRPEENVDGEEIDNDGEVVDNDGEGENDDEETEDEDDDGGPAGRRARVRARARQSSRVRAEANIEGVQGWQQQVCRTCGINGLDRELYS